MKRLIVFGPNIWIVDGPTVAIGGFQYRTRMAVVRLANGAAWLWSPVSFSEDLFIEIENKVGPVQHILSPNKLHHLNLKDWSRRCANARVYAPPGLKDRPHVREVKFTHVISDDIDEALSKDFDHVIFHNQFTMEEVVFFHKPSKTALFCDLIQRYTDNECGGWRGLKRRWDGLVGDIGGTPREWVWSFCVGDKSMVRKAFAVVVDEWRPERMVIAHGECAQENATLIISKALQWAA